MRIVSDAAARAMLCPFSLSATGRVDAQMTCAVTYCMAWRERKSRQVTDPGTHVERDVPYDVPHGYCALIP